MLPTNDLKQKLTQKETVFGTWSSLSSPNAISALCSTALDFVIVDMEHTSTSFETAENMLKSAQTTDCTPLIQTSDDREITILRALEVGCQAILVPHVEDPEAASRVVRACKYYPEGNRGMGPHTRHHRFGGDDLKTSFAYVNQETLVGILVEGSDGVERISEIARTPDLDLIYLGIYDISQSVGVPGELLHPKVVDGLKRSADTIRDRGLAAGSYAPNEQYVQLLISAGYQFIAYLNDGAALRTHFDSFMSNRLQSKRITPASS